MVRRAANRADLSPSSTLALTLSCGQQNVGELPREERAARQPFLAAHTSAWHCHPCHHAEDNLRVPGLALEALLPMGCLSPAPGGWQTARNTCDGVGSSQAGLLREVVESPFLEFSSEISRSHLNVVLGNLLSVALLMASRATLQPPPPCGTSLPVCGRQWNSALMPGNEFVNSATVAINPGHCSHLLFSFLQSLEPYKGRSITKNC